VYVFIIFPFPGLHATLVCVTCSQLEKLTADLLDIRQKLDTSEQDSCAEADRNQQVFCRMQMQLNGCIRYHHQILRYMHTLHVNLNYLLDIKRRYQFERYTKPKIAYKNDFWYNLSFCMQPKPDQCNRMLQYNISCISSWKQEDCVSVQYLLDFYQPRIKSKRRITAYTIRSTETLRVCASE
jgi:hypothetical protein